MSRMVPRRDAKRDQNERSIVLALRDAGYLVAEGGWLADLIVYDPNGGADKRGSLHLLEVKAAKGRLTPTQQEAINLGWPIRVVRSVAEAFDALNGAGG